MENKIEETVTISLNHYNELRDTMTAFQNEELFLNKQFNGYYFFTKTTDKDIALKEILQTNEYLLNENRKLNNEKYNKKVKKSFWSYIFCI